MATKLIQTHLLHPVSSSTNKIIRHFTATHSVTKRSHFPLLWTQTTAFAKAVHSGVEVEDDSQTIHQIKASLYDALQGINRGIFGVPSEKKAEIEGMVKKLESRNPTPEPTANLAKMAGNWRLVYSTITILGSKRTKLGLRDFINLGDFYQDIDVIEGKAVNVVEFSARGLNLFKGQLRIEATYKIASNSRVDILYQSSTISPEQLMNLFQKNYDLLLSIFNPEGWLNITYVDDDFRIGRDDKGNIFVLERLER